MPDNSFSLRFGDPDIETVAPERFRSAAYLSVLDDTPADARLCLPENAVAQLRRLAEAGYPDEICGLLIGGIDEAGWRIHAIRAVANLNQQRSGDRFLLDPAAYQAIDRELRGSHQEIVGVYHSHPDCPAKPSPTDLENAWEGFAYPIISVYQGKAVELRCWRLNEAGKRFQAVRFEIR